MNQIEQRIEEIKQILEERAELFNDEAEQIKKTVCKRSEG